MQISLGAVNGNELKVTHFSCFCQWATPKFYFKKLQKNQNRFARM